MIHVFVWYNSHTTLLLSTFPTGYCSDAVFFYAYFSESMVLVCQMIDMEEVLSSINDVTRSFVNVYTGFNTVSCVSCKLSCSKYFFIAK